VGTPFLERANDKPQERARAIIERRPDLERFFENGPLGSGAGRANVEVDKRARGKRSAGRASFASASRTSSIDDVLIHGPA
jgi:hypothetical protein